MHLLFRKALFMLGCLALSAAAKAQTEAITFNAAGQNYHDTTYSIGYEFNVNKTITVSALGFYDDLKNGLTESHAVGIYDSTGTLLTSTTVDPSDSLTGFFRYHSVTPITLLTANGYRIAAVNGNENYTWKVGGFATDPSITYVQDWWNPFVNTLQFPNQRTSPGDDPAYFGPNFLIGSNALVPETSSLALLMVGMAPGAALLRRRSRNR